MAGPQGVGKAEGSGKLSERACRFQTIFQLMSTKGDALTSSGDCFDSHVKLVNNLQPTTKSMANTSIHTATIGSGLYDVIKMREYMATFPVEEVNVADYMWMLDKSHKYWDDINGNPIGPADLLEDWEMAQSKPEWEEHVYSIKNAQLDKYPIWICNVPDDKDPSMRVNVIIDGVHRLTRAVLDGREVLNAIHIVYEDIPEEYRIK